MPGHAQGSAYGVVQLENCITIEAPTFLILSSTPNRCSPFDEDNVIGDSRYFVEVMTGAQDNTAFRRDRSQALVQSLACVRFKTCPRLVQEKYGAAEIKRSVEAYLMQLPARKCSQRTRGTA